MDAKDERKIILTIPATREDVLVVRTALGGAGLLMGLDIDRLDDLRAAADEACDYLLHQPRQAGQIEMVCQYGDGRMDTVFTALFNGKEQPDAQVDREMAQAILETLIPHVCFEADAQGVYRIRLGLPV